MRLFLAFLLDPAGQEAAYRQELWLKQHARSGSFPPKKNLHVSAAFLGECDQVQCLQAKDLVSQIRFEPAPIRFFRWERFHGDTYVLRGQAPQARMVADKLRKDLQALDLPFDRKPFKAHLTVGRRVFLQEPLPPLAFSSTLTRLVLFESTVEAGVRCYRELSSSK